MARIVSRRTTKLATGAASTEAAARSSPPVRSRKERITGMKFEVMWVFRRDLHEERM